MQFQRGLNHQTVTDVSVTYHGSDEVDLIDPDAVSDDHHAVASAADEPEATSRLSGLKATARWVRTEADWSITVWLAKHGVRLVQFALGIVFVWYGALKLMPGESPAAELVTATAAAVLDLVGLSLPGGLVLYLLGLFEVGLGMALLTDLRRQLVVLLALGHMASTAIPLVLLPEMVWTQFPLSLSLEGQFIFKNLVIVAGAAAIGATAHGGHLAWAPPADLDPRDADLPPSEAEQTLNELTWTDHETGTNHDANHGTGDRLPWQPAAADIGGSKDEPVVWVVDESGRLVQSFELDGYNHNADR